MTDQSHHLPDINKALEAAGIGVWHLNPVTGEVSLDKKAANLLGYPDAGLHTLETFFINADEKEAGLVAEFINSIRETNEEHSIKAKIRLNPANGSIRLMVCGKAFRSENGIEATGTIQEIRNSNFYEPKVGQWDLKAIIADAPLAIALYVGRELRVGLANDIMLSFWGKGRNVIGTRLEEAVPELEGQPFLDILDNVFTSGEIYEVVEAPAKLALGGGEVETYYFDFTYKPMYNDKGEIYAILNTAVNVTERVMSKRTKQEAQSRIKAIVKQSPTAIAFLRGKDMVIEVGNDKIFEVWGKGSEITGMPILEALPEIEEQGFMRLLENVYETGETFYGFDYLAKLEHNGVLKELYFDFTYSALLDESGNINGVLVLASDVTQRRENIRKLEESEQRIRAIIDSSPAAMAVFSGKELTVDITNKAFQEVAGRDDVIGKPLEEAMPEIKGQKSIELMHHVLDTGAKVHNYARPINIMKNGELVQNYFNVSYTPLFDADGNVTAVLDVAIDVTENIKARQAVEEAEASLRGAIELAELGTWSLYPDSGKVTYSQRMLHWFGLDGNACDISEILQRIHKEDREGISKAINAALQPESKGFYDEEYRVINPKTGRERILHAQGRAFFDEKGIPYIMSGTVQDITAQKKLQMELEALVKERTEALQDANIELEEANRRLINSNEELAQYAYVASHDLQEPLRKISMFSNLLKEKDVEGKHASITEKILKSSGRMSLLIKDLLEFSRLLNPDIRFTQVNLNEILQNIIGDFELKIEETHAKIKLDKLEVLEAVPLQMNQLFYNIVSNALKFIPKDKEPLIEISCAEATDAQVQQYIANPDRGNQYYIFSVADNGIGIKDEYLKQIFEVFKRLHARDEYSGSGIGLAICRRIVNNHNGAIFIESEFGKGTTFHIMLPKKQRKKLEL